MIGRMTVQAVLAGVLIAACRMPCLGATSDSPDAVVDEFGESRLPDQPGLGVTSPMRLFFFKWFAQERVAFLIPAVVLAGLFVRRRSLRAHRGLFLMASVVLFGFLIGPCPCSVSGVQCVFLKGAGATDCRPGGFILFLCLIPATYLFGRVWCGWICHMGALQEFIHLRGSRTYGTAPLTRKIIRVACYLFLAAFVVQIAVMKTNLFCQIDPFRTAFTLTSPFAISWILLGVVLVTSLYVTRPFCRTVCPVGLTLGWVSLIPGARVLNKGRRCTVCASCREECPTQAIREDMSVRHAECLMCGKCLDSCGREGTVFARRGQKGGK